MFDETEVKQTMENLKKYQIAMKSIADEVAKIRKPFRSPEEYGMSADEGFWYEYNDSCNCHPEMQRGYGGL